MRCRMRPVLFCILASAFLSLMFSCGPAEPQPLETVLDHAKEEADIIGVSGDGRVPLEVAVTIPPLAEFVGAVTANRANVTVMVPPGASPHTYEPKHSQLVSLSHASLYVKVGTPIEFELNWLPKILEMNPSMIWADCSKGIELIQASSAHSHEEEHPHQEEAAEEDHGEGFEDPHIWLSLKNAGTMVENITAALAEVDPAHEEEYRANMEDYLRQIDQLDAEIAAMFEKTGQKKFMVYHDAWNYFARDYGLVQIPIEKAGKEPTPKGIRDLIDQAKKEQIQVIFASPELNTASAELIAQEIGAAVVLISPLAGDYLENMQKISREISKGIMP